MNSTVVADAFCCGSAQPVSGGSEDLEHYHETAVELAMESFDFADMLEEYRIQYLRVEEHGVEICSA